MSKRILIMGLPGSGKTTLALSLLSKLHKLGRTVEWLNADDVRKQYNDWDFSAKGRIRQSQRMRELADKSRMEYVIADFIAPLPEMRDIYSPDYLIWVDTIDEGRFEDTNKMFVEPNAWDLRVDEFDAEYWSKWFIECVLEL
jgi:adenylylsulfate kinase